MDAGSSSGRTLGSDPSNRGSNPCPAATIAITISYWVSTAGQIPYVYGIIYSVHVLYYFQDVR